MPSYATSTTTYGQGNHTWLRTSKGLKTTRTVTLDVSTFTANTHYPAGYIPSGVTLGPITTEGTYGPYSNAAADGRTVMAGFLLNDEEVPTGATFIVATLLTEGDVIEARLPTGHGLDANGKTDVGNRFTYA